jgi:uncharacterized protein YcfJ
MYASARLGLLLLITLTTSATAQHTIAGPQPSQVLSAAGRGPLQQSVAVDTVPRDIRPTRWKEGALIGGLATGAALGFLMYALCSSSDNVRSCGGMTVGGVLLGGAIGAVAGALIGGQFPKGEQP